MKQFEKVQMPRIKRATHNLSHELKLTANFGNLIPVLTQEVLPGDRFKIQSETLVRIMPLIAPIMHRVNVYLHYFFVPNRIIWNEWEDFITGGRDGKQMPNVPKIIGKIQDDWQSVATWRVNTLGDYLGIPVERLQAINNNNTLEISQLPFRAYTQIYNDYYRPSLLTPEVVMPSGSINVNASTSQPWFNLQIRGWENDYFTSALPTPQLGDAVTIPLGEYAPVKGAHWLGLPDEPITMSDKDGGPTTTGQVVLNSSGYLADINNQITVKEGLYADLTSATSATISDLRRSFALQRWLEKNSRAGYRYFEQIFSHFQVKSPDSRLQRAEYIGGGKMPVIISEVLQTSETSNESALGQFAGHGASAGRIARANYMSQEHGLIMGIMSIMPRTGYMQGLPKFWQKFDRFDFYFSEFAHIGEESLNSEELYLQGKQDAHTFGYMPRYQEYRYEYDKVAGRLRTKQLDFWHMARRFENMPTLNKQFIEYDPITRIFAMTEGDYDQTVVQIYHKITAVRPVAKYGTPI